MTRSRARITVCATMQEEDVPKAKAALQSAHLRVIGKERVNTTFGVMFHDPVAGRARIMYDLVTIKMRAQMESAGRHRTRVQSTDSAGDGHAR